jgi:hypothetical protein
MGLKLFTFFSCLLVASSAFAAPIKIPALKICISGNGTLSAKTKCSKAEATASFNDFKGATTQGTQGPAGPQGPQGPAGSNGVVNISSCRSIVSSKFTTNGTAGATVTCNNNEFLLNYGNYTLPTSSLQFLASTEVYYSGGIPYGVAVLASTQVGITDSYTLYVTGTCCPG